MTRPRDAALAAELGASHVGVIFAESPRRVTVEQASEVFALAGDAKRVGVFGHAGISSEMVIRHAKDLRLDVLQLHGGFLPTDVVRLRHDFDGELWAVVPIDRLAGELPEGWDGLAEVSDALLIDTSVRGVSGGTGVRFDWKAAAPSILRAASRIPIVLAGGLNAGNVGEAIATLRPGTVDVSSGVESAPGVKDPFRMRAFADAVVSASIVG